VFLTVALQCFVDFDTSVKYLTISVIDKTIEHIRMM